MLNVYHIMHSYSLHQCVNVLTDTCPLPPPPPPGKKKVRNTTATTNRVIKEDFVPQLHSHHFAPLGFLYFSKGIKKNLYIYIYIYIYIINCHLGTLLKELILQYPILFFQLFVKQKVNNILFVITFLELTSSELPTFF